MAVYGIPVKIPDKHNNKLHINFNSVARRRNIKGEKTSLLYPHSSHERIPTTVEGPVGSISDITQR